MTKTKIDKVLRFCILVLGVIIFANAVYVTAISKLNVGIYLTYLIGAFLIACTLTPIRFIKKVPRILRFIVIIGFAVLIAFVLFLYIYGNLDDVGYDEDAVIVLGAGLRGENVSQHLKNRLDAAIDYHKQNPEAVIVVSGGQGPDEIIDEATAMERYLLENGIEQDKIIKESSSTSTEENFLFSKEILDERFSSDYKVAFITNDYHSFRSFCRAKSVGYTKITHYGAKTPLHSILPNGLREVLGVLEFWLLDDMERDSFVVPLLILFK